MIVCYSFTCSIEIIFRLIFGMDIGGLCVKVSQLTTGLRRYLLLPFRGFRLTSMPACTYPIAVTGPYHAADDLKSLFSLGS